MPEIVQGNRRIYYESHGEGYPLVLIRGLGSNADHWYAQVPDPKYSILEFSTPDVLQLDLRQLAQFGIGSEVAE